MGIELEKRQSPKLRGYFARKYSEIIELHNHTEEGFIYNYPLVQYKIIDKSPTIIGINEGANLVARLALTEEEVMIDNQVITLENKKISSHLHKIVMTNQAVQYEFITPYVALNQNNHKKYIKLDAFDQEEMIKKILIGNILSFSKGIRHTITNQIKVSIQLKEIKVQYKNKEMLGFKGSFSTNIVLPDLIGLGKSVSRGFGTIKKV